MDTLDDIALIPENTFSRGGIEPRKIINSPLEIGGSELDDHLILGLMGTNHELLAMFSESELDRGASENMPITTLVIPNTNAGSLLVNEDRTSVAVNSFYMWHDGAMQFVTSKKPILLDGLFSAFDGFIYDYHGPEDVLLNPIDGHKVTANKALVKFILRENSISTPEFELISEKDENVLSKIKGFSQEHPGDFVVKPIGFSASRGVEMYTGRERIKASNHARSLLGITEMPVMVDERISPLEWEVDGKRQDWNVRALVTLSENPKFIGGFVRYDDYGRDPILTGKRIDIFNGGTLDDGGRAKTRPLSRAPFIDSDNYAEIIETSQNVANAIRHYIKQKFEIDANGYISLDLFLGTNSKCQQGVYVIECDIGTPNGLLTLTKIRYALKDPALLTIKDTLIPSFRSFLEENHRKRNTAGPFSRIRNAIECYKVAEHHMRNDEYGKAIMSYDESIRLKNDFLPAYYKQGMLFEMVGRTREAMRCYSSIISNPVKEGENYPNFDVRYMKHLASIRLSYLERASNDAKS
tara:strand:- start:1160 stop:2734 length:1575 start_codon:yes stop_codon:yes gene_type:complete